MMMLCQNVEILTQHYHLYHSLSRSRQMISRLDASR